MMRSMKKIGAEPNCLRITGKVTIFGDVHGQYYDLYKIFNKHADFQPNSKILFLGDYVDRGEYGMEIVLFLCALKIRYPNNIFLLRGNHESREMT